MPLPPLLPVVSAPTLAVLKLDYGMVVTLVGATLTMAVQLLLTWSKEEILRQHTGTRVLQYPLGVRILVKGLWVVGIGLLVLAGLAIGGPHAEFALAFAIAVNVFVLVMHLLVFGERVTWDEYQL